MKIFTQSMLFFAAAWALCACSAILDSRPSYIDSGDGTGNEDSAADSIIGEDGGPDGSEDGGPDDTGELPTSILEGVEAISAGGSHTCALLEGGEVMCWGANESGQLADGTQVNRSVAVSVYLPQDAISISCGESHTCAVLDNGKVICWGLNLDGQVFPDIGHPDIVANPHQIDPWFGYAASVCAGRSHSCAAMAEGGDFSKVVVCWGANEKGQLGRGDEIEHTDAVEVKYIEVATPLSNISGVTCGADHTCAWIENGKALCWGDNSSRQLGRDTTGDISVWAIDTILESAFLLVPIQGMTAGTSHTCAWLTGGNGYCWGSDDHGQLCNGMANSYPYPDLITGFEQPVSVMSAGRYHGCAIPTGNVGIGCWGDNESGQVDAGATAEDKFDDSYPVSSERWTAVSAGGSHTCAVDEERRVHCWGDNSHGQLGNGTFDNPVTGMSAVIRL